MKETTLIGYNNLKLYTRVYDNVKKAKAVVQIIHGMLEHGGRYDRFCQMLESNGYIVIITDLRGHGKTSESFEKLGHGEKDIFGECVEDQIKVSEYIKENYNLPLYIFAHSWGSMIAQEYLQKCHLAEKVVLCGTTNGNNSMFKLGKFLSAIISFFCGKKTPAKLISNVNNNLYQKGFEDGNWLSRDYNIWEEYKKDPYTKAMFPLSFYRSLFSHMTKVNKGIENIKKDTSILLIVGSKDPVSEQSKQVTKLYNIYKKHNLDVQLKIYEDARHELINETNKEEVDNDILTFYKI